ncbi:hypothetical protein GRAN_1712 [Granulicella sibirica]|uniref:Uncharacterized protein n=1 Tax=Granulicella sibirica TaxID=2479048 RepID=A0A4Q0T5Y2_9BACT|nr:hypothetical protein GRAN_1712 [Granulicella sibirica]
MGAKEIPCVYEHRIKMLAQKLNQSAGKPRVRVPRRADQRLSL